MWNVSKLKSKENDESKEDSRIERLCNLNEEIFGTDAEKVFVDVCVLYI